MNILTEIVETVDAIMDNLKIEGFFDTHIFCDPFKLRREFEIQMQRNWEQLDDMYLLDTQFLEIVKKLTIEGVYKTFGEMVMDGTIMMDSVDQNGELIYKLNPEMNINDL